MIIVYVVSILPYFIIDNHYFLINRENNLHFVISRTTFVIQCTLPRLLDVFINKSNLLNDKKHPLPSDLLLLDNGWFYFLSLIHPILTMFLLLFSLLSCIAKPTNQYALYSTQFLPRRCTSLHRPSGTYCLKCSTSPVRTYI